MESLYQELRRRILIGELRPGAVLSQVKLAEAFGTGRTPLREALRILQREGLSEVQAPHPRGGAQVVLISDLGDTINPAVGRGAPYVFAPVPSTAIPLTPASPNASNGWYTNPPPDACRGPAGQVREPD